MPELPHSILDHLLEGCQVISFDWTYLFLNEVAAQHGRQGKEQLLGRTMMDAYPGIERTAMFGRLRRCLEQRTHEKMENEFT
ncbi:MAG: PAS domain-containing protein, partial [Myxococcaceae bacterium]